MNIFYQSHVQWFENVANGAIWLIIAAVVACLVWLAYDIVKGSSLPDGIEPISADKKISSHKAGAKPGLTVAERLSMPLTGETTITRKGSSSPFAPKSKVKASESKSA